MSDIVERLKEDYAHFPEDQTYSLYTEDIKFKDPLNSFSGVGRYRLMIGFIGRFFNNVQMDLHEIQQPSPSLITMKWTLHMSPPVPWSARLSIPGHTELGLNTEGLINSHIDYWNCSRLAVLMQVFNR